METSTQDADSTAARMAWIAVLITGDGMGFRFRKSIKILPGLRLNLSRSGVSANVGVRGASVTVSSRGTFVNSGIPGTGVSYRERIDEGHTLLQETPPVETDRQGRSFAGPLSVLIVIAIILIIAIIAGSK